MATFINNAKRMWEMKMDMSLISVTGLPVRPDKTTVLMIVATKTDEIKNNRIIFSCFCESGLEVPKISGKATSDSFILISLKAN